MKIEEAAIGIYQSRSRYQIEKFVVGQHDSPEMQYKQLVIEASGLIETIKESELRIEKIKSQANELRETGLQSNSIEAEIVELEIPRLEKHIQGANRELAIMQELFDSFPKFTNEEIEQAQESYWKNRLVKVAELQMLGKQVGVDWAQLEAIHQSGNLEEALLEIPTMNKLVNNEISSEIATKMIENIKKASSND